MQVDVTLREDTRITVDLEIDEIKYMIEVEDISPSDLFSATDLGDWAINNGYVLA